MTDLEQRVIELGRKQIELEGQLYQLDEKLDNIIELLLTLTEGKPQSNRGRKQQKTERPPVYQIDDKLRSDILNNPAVKLDETKVREIRQAAAAGEDRRVLSKRYGVSVKTIKKVISGQTWAWVE